MRGYAIAGAHHELSMGGLKGYCKAFTTKAFARFVKQGLGCQRGQFAPERTERDYPGFLNMIWAFRVWSLSI